MSDDKAGVFTLSSRLILEQEARTPSWFPCVFHTHTHTPNNEGILLKADEATSHTTGPWCALEKGSYHYGLVGRTAILVW